MEQRRRGVKDVHTISNGGVCVFVGSCYKDGRFNRFIIN